MDGGTLGWPGSYNVRDLGGLPTGDGRRTRTGALVRSESPAFFEPAAWGRLEAHGIRTCVDLRSSWEVEVGAYRCPTGVTRVQAPLEEGLLDDPAFAALAADGSLATALYFAPYLDRWPGRAAAALRAIGDAPPGGVLFHCERGRDRTGLIAILLLHLAGVPDDVIVTEHLRTDNLLRDRGVGLGHVPMDGEAETYERFGTNAEATVRALLERLDVVAILRADGASTAEIESLRSRLAG